jgi:hypothetical protein
MDLSNLFPQAPSYISGLLGEDEADRLRRQAQQSGLLNIGLSLLAGAGPQPQRTGIGQLLAQGVMAGQQASRNAYEQAVKDKMMQQQLQEMAAKQQRQAQIREIFPQVFTETVVPGQEIKTYQSMTPQQIESAVGKPDFVAPSVTTVIPPKKQLSIDTNKLQALAMLSEDPLAGLANIAKIVPELRKAGFAGEQTQQENPFAIFSTDPTLPAPIRAIAKQYETSYQRGLLDPEKVDERIKQLGDAAQRASQNVSSEQLRRDQMAQSAAIAAGQQSLQGAMLELRRAAEEAKPEQFSYAQKKDFDAVTESRDEAKKAASNASIASRAAPLLQDAYSGMFEAGAKNLAGAIGISTKAKDANDKLTQLSNQLAVNAPKFSGPTSDRDAARYDAAVGDLANPKKSIESKQQALRDIQDLSKKAQNYANQQENYFYQNKKSLRGFVFKENPYEGM